MQYYIYNIFSKNRDKINTNEYYYDLSNSSSMDLLISKINKEDIIVIIGGDGTLNYCLNKYPVLLNSNIQYYKNGTGNDFHRSLENNTMSYYYYINNEYLFINGCGIGLDALVCKKVNDLKTKNKLSYIVEAYRSIQEYEPITLKVTIDNNEVTYNKVWLCSLQNGKYFGSGIKIAKDALINEEDLTLCIGYNLNKFKMIFLLVFVKFGLVHLIKNNFKTMRTNNVIIESNTNFLAQFDGETKNLESKLELTSKHIINIKSYK